MIKEINKSDLPYSARCYSCSQTIHVEPTAEYGYTHTCRCGNEKVSLVKPKHQQFISSLGNIVSCHECGQSLSSLEPTALACKCNCVSVLFYSGVTLKFEGDTLNFNMVRDITITGGVVEFRRLSYEGIDQRIDYIIRKFQRALILNSEVTRNLGRSNSYTIRSSYGGGSTIDFNVDTRTLTLDDSPNHITLVFDENFKPTITALSGYSDYVMYTYLSGFCRAVLDIIGDIDPIDDLKELLGSQWDEIGLSTLAHINEHKGKIYIGGGWRNNYGRPQSPTSNWQHWFDHIRHTRGYKYDVFVSTHEGLLDFVFAYQRDSNENTELFEQIITSENGLDSLNELVEAKRRTTGMSPGDRRVIKDRVISRIRVEGADKCIECGGLIHSIRAFKPFEDQDVLIESKGVMGALCCGCFGKYRAKIEYSKKENAPRLEEMKKEEKARKKEAKRLAKLES